MHHVETSTKRSGVRSPKSANKRRKNVESRYTVGLNRSLSSLVERYAQTVDMSMSKAIAALVRLGLDSHEDRKREFFKRLKENLENDSVARQDDLVDEFRTLILGR